MGRKRRRVETPQLPGVELNVMPFIDIFSLLCTFLLFSAVFIAIGIVEVQVPFLSNAASAKREATKPQRTLSVDIEIMPQAIEVRSSFSRAPVEARKKSFPRDRSGRRAMHRYLLALKRSAPKTDKATLFADDGTDYQSLVKVLDEVKYLRPNERVGASQPESERASDVQRGALFPKVIMGDVLL